MSKKTAPQKELAKKDQKKRIQPYLTPQAINFYDRAFDTAAEGVSFACESFPIWYTNTLRELRGKFTRGELSMIIDILNGTVIMPYFADSIWLEISDSFDLYPGVYEDKWSADKKTFIGKIEALTHFQRCCLEIWAKAFWSGDYNAPDAIANHCKILEG